MNEEAQLIIKMNSLYKSLASHLYVLHTQATKAVNRAAFAYAASDGQSYKASFNQWRDEADRIIGMAKSILASTHLTDDTRAEFYKHFPSLQPLAAAPAPVQPEVIQPPTGDIAANTQVGVATPLT